MEQAPSLPPIETAGYDHNLRLYDDTTTWLAEVLEGSMRTPFSYSFNGHELYGRDGSPLKTIFKDALNDAETLAANQPNLVFELRRRWLEMGEYRDMIAMANAELPNTMIVISDFPPELMESNQDIGGYNVSRKQTMLRIISRGYDGSLTMQSQSLDGSNRQALETIFHSLGFEPEEGELLGQRLHIDLPARGQQVLVDKLMGIYDRSLTDQYGGEWYAGRTPAVMLNTYDFVRQQDDLLTAFIHGAEAGTNEGLLYDLAAAMRQRFTKCHAVLGEAALPAKVITLPTPLNEMHIAGLQARSEGRTFSGCGASLTGDGMSSLEEFRAVGYGNKSGPEASYKFDKQMHCVVCQPSPKKDEPKKMCGPCGICRTCDAKLKKDNK